MRDLKYILKVGVLGIWLMPILSMAQKAETPDAIYDIGGKINDMILTEVGTLVVASNDGLIGIKPESKELVFNFMDYGRVKPERASFSTCFTLCDRKPKWFWRDERKAYCYRLFVG